MTYADFTYYQQQFMGSSISEDDFPRLALRASQFLDYYTKDRSKKDPEREALKMACCALAEQYQLIDSARAAQAKALSASAEKAGQELQSETVGPWSRTYKSGGEAAASINTLSAEAQAALAGIARQYLANTGLLYRGGGYGRCFHTP